MKVIRTAISDVLIIEPTVYSDDRGWFMESFNADKFETALKELGLPAPGFFSQDNHSCSKRGVIRGLHFQNPPYAQGKLVRVTQGRAYDVAVDIRPSSPTFGAWVGVELTASNKRQLWIPAGFAHGFLAQEDNTHFLYKTTGSYHKSSEGAIRWDDNDLAIKWPSEVEIVSEKDQAASSFKEYMAADLHARLSKV